MANKDRALGDSEFCVCDLRLQVHKSDSQESRKLMQDFKKVKVRAYIESMMTKPADA